MNAVTIADGELTVVDRPAPERPAGEARVRVRLAGVCSTDLELARGYMRFAGTPGHEFLGEVTAGPEALVGARVVGEINAACGTCPTCRDGHPRHCPARTVLGILGRDGAHADELCLPVTNLHRVPDEVPDEVAVFTEPLAAAWHVVEQVPVAGKRVAVLGAGKLGQLIARAVRLAGAEVTAVSRSDRKRQLAADAGIEACAPEAAPAAGYDVVVEATGQPAGLSRALALVRPLGTVVLKTTTHAPVEVPLAPAVVDEVTLVGSRCGRFEPALRLLASGAVDPRPLVDHRVPLADAARAYRLAAEPGTLKVLLEMS